MNPTTNTNANANATTESAIIKKDPIQTDDFNPIRERDHLQLIEIVTFEKKFGNIMDCLFLKENIEEDEEKIYTCECVGNNLTYICQACYLTCHISKYCNKYLIRTVYKNENSEEGKKKIKRENIFEDSHKVVTCYCGKFRHIVPGLEKEEQDNDDKNVEEYNRDIINQSVKNNPEEENDPEEEIKENNVAAGDNYQPINSEIPFNQIENEVIVPGMEDSKDKILQEKVVVSECIYKDIIKYCIPKYIYDCNEEYLRNSRKKNKKITESLRFMRKDSAKNLENVYSVNLWNPLKRPSPSRNSSNPGHSRDFKSDEYLKGNKLIHIKIFYL